MNVPRENKVLATPLENNDQSAFIARPNISSECVCGGGGDGDGAQFRPYGAS